jgi:hypothetical protein
LFLCVREAASTAEERTGGCVSQGDGRGRGKECTRAAVIEPKNARGLAGCVCVCGLEGAREGCVLMICFNSCICTRIAVTVLMDCRLTPAAAAAAQGSHWSAVSGAS